MDDYQNYLDNLFGVLDTNQTAADPKHYMPRKFSEMDDVAKQMLGDKCARQSEVRAEQHINIKSPRDAINYILDWNFYPVKNCRRLGWEQVINVNMTSDDKDVMMKDIEEAIISQVLPRSRNWCKNDEFRDVFGRFRLSLKLENISESKLPLVKNSISSSATYWIIALTVYEPRWSYNLSRLTMEEMYFFDAVLAYWDSIGDMGSDRLRGYIKEFAYNGRFNVKAIDYLAQRTIGKGDYSKYFKRYKKKTGVVVPPLPISLFDKTDWQNLPDNVRHYKQRKSSGLTRLFDGKFKQFKR